MIKRERWRIFNWYLSFYFNHYIHNLSTSCLAYIYFLLLHEWDLQHINEKEQIEEKKDQEKRQDRIRHIICLRLAIKVNEADTINLPYIMECCQMNQCSKEELNRWEHTYLSRLQFNMYPFLFSSLAFFSISSMSSFLHNNLFLWAYHSSFSFSFSSSSSQTLTSNSNNKDNNSLPTHTNTNHLFDFLAHDWLWTHDQEMQQWCSFLELIETEQLNHLKGLITPRLYDLLLKSFIKDNDNDKHENNQNQNQNQDDKKNEFCFLLSDSFTLYFQEDSNQKKGEERLTFEKEKLEKVETVEKNPIDLSQQPIINRTQPSLPPMECDK